MPFPSPGRLYCDTCQPEAKRRHLRAYYLRRQAAVWSHKIGLGCSECGYAAHGAALDWHHPDANKERRLSVTGYFTPKEAAERAKCVLLCANCHRAHHAEETE